jgi:hypothetical protein
MIIDMSRRVRDRAIKEAEEIEAEEEKRLTDIAARLSEVVTVATRCAEGKVARLAKRLAVKIHAGESEMSHRQLIHFLKATERHLLDQAIAEAEAHGWTISETPPPSVCSALISAALACPRRASRAWTASLAVPAISVWPSGA